MTKKKRTPPRNTGHKLPPSYQAVIGERRTCATCGKTKTITFKTFAPNRKSSDGVAEVCRVCQGSAARRKQMDAGVGKPRKGSRLSPPNHPTGWPDPIKNRKAYWARVEELTDRLYALSNQPHKTRQLNEIRADLNKVTRLWDDPAGGGEQRDQELAFRTFVAVLSRLINDWVPFGVIHDEDIIPALLDPSDQVLILASRNSGKSTVVAMYGAWLLHRNPLDIVGVVSGATRRAKRLLRTVRQFITNCPLLSHLEPDDTCIDSAEQFMVSAANGKLGDSVSFSSYGIASAMTGTRFNKAILDDVELKRDRTPGAQETLDLLTSEVSNILNPGGRVVALGTPQVAGMSIYARWASSNEWALYRALLFEEIPQDDGSSKRPQLRSRWLSRWTDEQLEKKRKRLPSREWDLHWRISLEALDQDDRPIKLRDFITVKWDSSALDFPTIVRPGGDRLDYLETGVADANDYFRGPSSISPRTSPYLVTCAAVDPASGMVGRDECGVSIVSVTAQGLAVIRCIAGVRGRSAQETLTNVASLIHGFYPTKVVCEARADSLFPGQLGSVLARRGYPIIVDPVQSGARKGERIIDSILVLLADTRLVLLEDVVTGEDAMETVKQLTHITRDARHLLHDDRCDSLSWALAIVKEMLLGDEADGLQTASEQDLERLLALPLRKGGITEDSLLARTFEMNEDEERLQMKLERALEIQAEELRQGRVDPQYARYIEKLRAEIQKARRANVCGMSA